MGTDLVVFKYQQVRPRGFRPRGLSMFFPACQFCFTTRLFVVIMPFVSSFSHISRVVVIYDQILIHPKILAYNSLLFIGRKEMRRKLVYAPDYDAQKIYESIYCKSSVM